MQKSLVVLLPPRGGEVAQSNSTDLPNHLVSILGGYDSHHCSLFPFGREKRKESKTQSTAQK